MRRAERLGVTASQAASIVRAVPAGLRVGSRGCGRGRNTQLLEDGHHVEILPDHAGFAVSYLDDLARPHLAP